MLFSPLLTTVPEWVEGVSVAVEVFAITIIVAGIAYASFLILYRLLRRQAEDHYATYKAILGRSLLLGLEILVAADIIRTVALDPTLESVAVLGLLVLVRTFLSWSIIVEIEGRWPWQPERAERKAATRPSAE
jgi:uncharacterized membrane protein